MTDSMSALLPPTPNGGGDSSLIVAITYIVIGLFGFVCNLLILIMILTVPAYHKSAYLLMANIAVADAIQSMIVGCYVGVVILMDSDRHAHVDEQQHHHQQHQSRQRRSDGDNATSRMVDRSGVDDVTMNDAVGNRMEYSISILTITAWFVMIHTYAALGINRCVGTCFYKTKMRRFNRIRATNITVVVIWLVSISGGIAATYPRPIIFVQPKLWTMRFMVESTRSVVFVWFNISTNAISILMQWTCSIFVLTTVHKIQKRITNHKISSASARRSQRQARLSFQFFYPSIICTLSSLMFFSMPLYIHLMSRWHFFVSHMVWLINHVCNPFIYIYFNGRMRDTLRLWMQCRRDIGHSVVSRFHAAISNMTPYTTTGDRRSITTGGTGQTGGGMRATSMRASLPQLQQFNLDLIRYNTVIADAVTDGGVGGRRLACTVPLTCSDEEEEEELATGQKQRRKLTIREHWDSIILDDDEDDDDEDDDDDDDDDDCRTSHVAKSTANGRLKNMGRRKTTY